MQWTTPKIVEIACGCEINAYFPADLWAGKPAGGGAAGKARRPDGCQDESHVGPEPVIDRAGGGQEIAPPVSLLAELTHRCPLQCPYCSNPLALEKAAAELDTALGGG